MCKQRRLITLWLTLLAVSLSAFAQEKVLLQYKAQAGQMVRYRVTGTTEVEVMGNAVRVEVNIVSKRRILEVSPEGNIQYEEEAESFEVSRDGQRVPLPDAALPGKVIYTIKPNGEIIKREASQEETDNPFAGAASGGTIPVFSTQPVGAG
ncbi:MAG: hypothetical protein RMJ83_10485, partial [Armatimonadota bacterium]|nr:hypothetical protein [Armatimonadota bacterium]